MHVGGADGHERKLGRATTRPGRTAHQRNGVGIQPKAVQHRIHGRARQPAGHVNRRDGALLECNAARDMHKLRNLQVGVLDAGPDDLAIPKVDVDRITRRAGPDGVASGRRSRRREARRKVYRGIAE